MHVERKVRANTYDLGCMKIVGKGFARGKLATDKAGKSDEVRHCMKSSSNIAANYYTSIDFGEEIDSIFLQKSYKNHSAH